MRFEYTTVEFKSGEEVPLGHLNKLGSNGWEVIQIHQFQERMQILLKREGVATGIGTRGIKL